MADAVWYYAQDDREHGPVTAAYIAGMARTGKLRPDDLVWREGMEDWRPAKTIKGLFAAASHPAGRSSDTAVLESPFEALPPDALGGASDAAEAKALREPPEEASDADLPEPPPPPVESGSRRFRESSPFPLDPAGLSRTSADADERTATFDPARRPPPLSESPSWLLPAARALAAVGLLLALGVKGCETIGGAAVLRLAAQASLAQAEFDPEGGSGLHEDARRAALRHQAWGLMREVGFFTATVLLTVGLLPVTWLGHGGERWLAVLLLAVVAFYVFVGGVAPAPAPVPWP